MSEPSKLVDLLTRSRDLLIQAVEGNPEHAPAILPAYLECNDLLERLTNETEKPGIKQPESDNPDKSTSPGG